MLYYVMWCICALWAGGDTTANCTLFQQFPGNRTAPVPKRFHNLCSNDSIILLRNGKVLLWFLDTWRIRLSQLVLSFLLRRKASSITKTNIWLFASRKFRYKREQLRRSAEELHFFQKLLAISESVAFFPILGVFLLCLVWDYFPLNYYLFSTYDTGRVRFPLQHISVWAFFHQLHYIR